jgi:L-malate glycosyltransferase
MKILQLVTKRQYRGAEVFAANLSEELIKLGHEILFVGLYTNKSNVLHVKHGKNLDLSGRRKEGISPSLVFRLVNLIKKENPDVVQCNGSDTLKYMVAATYFVSKVPLVYRNISTISEWLNSGIKKEIYRQLFKHVDHVTSVGNESINDLISTFDYPVEKTSVIRRGIPFQEFNVREAAKKLRNELDLKSTNQIVAHVGNFSPEKNHSFLLDVFSELKMSHPAIKLVCIGNGVTFQKISEEIQRKGLENTVYLLGFRKDIPQLLAGSDCFALCSLVEGVPGVILEAAVQKKPSVATNVGGVQEVIRNNETGFIIDDFNKTEFRNRIISILEDHDLRDRMGEKAYQLVRNEFNSVKNARSFEVLYEALKNQKKSAGSQKPAPQNLRILQVIQKKQYRGAEIFSCQLSNHLVQQGHHVKICSIYGGNAKLPFQDTIDSLNRPRNARHVDFKGWKAIAKMVEEFRPHIVQANASDTLKYAVLSKAFFGWETPIIYRNASISSYYIKSFASRFWNRELLKKVDQIVSVSEWSKKDLNNIFPFTKEKTKVITIGVEPKEVHSTSPFKDIATKNILHVGSLTCEKNHMELLEMFKEVWLCFPESRLHLIGEGSQRTKIVSRIKDLGLSRVVFLHGEIQKPLDYISFADVLVLPSLVEGLPAVILEAMYYRTPVVAYSVGGIAEVLDDNTGYLVESGDKEGFKRSIQEILLKRPEGKIERAKDRVETSFMNRDLVKCFLDTYYEVLK